MIIDPTDFLERPYKIPNQEESRDFLSFLEEKEDELARMILGNDLWEDFDSAINGSGVIDPIYEALRDGGSYEYNNKSYRYNGWVDMIRPGIFSEWLPLTTMKLTNIGYVVNDAPDKSKLLDNQYEFQVAHWNKFITKVGYVYAYGYNYVDSFYGFMKINEDDYPDWVFQCPRYKHGYKNRYDL
jgi:hypothetical protein